VTSPMTEASYYTPRGGLPPQTDLLTDRAIVTEAYTVIPRGVLSDIVTSVLPEWTDTRAWIVNRPVAGGATTYYQAIVEVKPGGGAQRPEPQPEVQSFLFVTSGALTVDAAGQSQVLAEGGFAHLPAGTDWSAHNNGDADATFVWVRKRYEAIEATRRRSRSATSGTSNRRPCRGPTANGVRRACSIRRTWRTTCTSTS